MPDSMSGAATFGMSADTRVDVRFGTGRRGYVVYVAVDHMRYARRVAAARQRAAWISEQIELVDAEVVALPGSRGRAATCRRINDVATRLGSILAAQMQLDRELDDLALARVWVDRTPRTGSAGDAGQRLERPS